MSSVQQFLRDFGPDAEKRGLLYCPWRERFVEPPILKTAADWRNRYALPHLNPNTHAPRELQGKFIETFLRERNNDFLFQADPGEGKTFTALTLSSFFLARGERVLFVVTTRDLLQQVAEEARQVLVHPTDGSVDDYLSLLDGRIAPTRRASVYSDLRKQLLVVTAPTLANDLKHKRINLSDFALLIQDEGDLMRGREAHARINQQWQSLEQRPRGIIMSATLTVAHNPHEDHREVQALKAATGFTRFFQIPAPDKLNYSISSNYKGYLGPDETPVVFAARQLRDEFRLQVQRLEPSALPDRDNIPLRFEECRSKVLRESAEKPGMHCLPSVKLVTQLLDLAKQNQTSSAPWQERQAHGLQIRHAAAALELFHLHKLLTTELRVSFLEHGGHLLYQARHGVNKPHLHLLFPPGTPPTWWSTMAHRTPYEQLQHITPRALGPAGDLMKHPTDGELQSNVFEERFFATDKRLGRAAELLLEQQGPDHPKLYQIKNWCLGSLRKRNNAQTLVYCGSAVEAMYARAFMARLSRETTGLLVGHSHTDPKARAEQFQAASAGTSTLISSTSVAGRGVNLLKLKYLLVLNVPTDLREVKQLFGRVGRDPNNPGTVVIMYTDGCADERALQVLRSKSVAFGTHSPLYQELHRSRRTKGPTLFEDLNS